MKKNRSGKASIFNSIDIKKLRKAFSVPHHRAILEIALHTGERMGAIVQLKIDDVYLTPKKVHPEITFRAITRKARPDGARETRQITIHPDLREFLINYDLPKNSSWLFPGRTEDKHITYDSVYQYWCNKFLETGLDKRGFSTHSSRRWFITSLVRNGTDPKTIQTITGHKSMNVLMGYAESDPITIKNAIANITT